MKPKISIVIVVKNDRGIADTLAGLAAQPKPVPTEIIVVDASKPSVLADIRQQYSYVRWYQFTPPVSGKSTIPEQRNFGVREAEGDIIVFIDASCTPSEHWLIDLTRPLLEEGESIVAGTVRALHPETQINYHTTSTGDSKYVAIAGGGNLAFTKSLWSKLGGFDESFLFSSDTDFVWRCVDAGYKIRYVMSAAIICDWGDFNVEVKRSINYGIGRARLFRKYPHRIRAWQGSFYILFYTMYLIGLPLTFYFWWYPFVIVVALAKNVNNKPFKTVSMNLIYVLSMWAEFFRMIFKSER